MKPGAHIDYTALDKLEELQIPGESDMILELIELFNQQQAEATKTITTAIGLANFKDVTDEAHKFKSTCWTLGATTLGNLLEELEQVASKREMQPVKQKFQAVLAELEPVKSELNGLKAKRAA